MNNKFLFCLMTLGGCVFQDVHADQISPVNYGKVGMINSVMYSLPFVSKFVTREDAEVLELRQKISNPYISNDDRTTILQSLEKAAQAQQERDNRPMWHLKKILYICQL